MIKVESYIDMNKHLAEILYVKKTKLDSIYSVNSDKYSLLYEEKYYDIIEKQYFKARSYRVNESFLNEKDNILYDNLNYYILIKEVDELKINQLIAAILNNILNDSYIAEIDNNISFIIQISEVCECDDQEEIDIGHIEYSLIRFDFETKYKDKIDIREIKKYLNKDIKNRIKFVDLRSNSFSILILPLDDDELINILKKFLVLKQLLLI